MDDNKVTFLSPIQVDCPPKHTQVFPQCFTCNKFEVCNLRLDYLKTAKLIQQVLGDPQEDYELCKTDPTKFYPCYKGTYIEDPETIFPEQLTITKRILPSGETMDETVIAELKAAKYQDLNTVLFVYESDGYVIVFYALYNYVSETYDIKNGMEIVYHIIYEFPEESVLEVQTNLVAWREEMEDKERENEDIDIINTTHFSALLQCHFFDPIRGLTPEEGVKRLVAKFPEGIPLGEDQYYHLATFHIEPNKVPPYNPNEGKIAFAPIAYPVFVPAKCQPKKCVKRDDLCD